MSTTPPTDCWLDDRAEVRASGIEGAGLFARTAIPAGTPVSRFGGRVVDDVELRRLIATSTVYVDTLSIDRDRNLVLPPGTPNHAGNHSCDPNLWWVDPFTLTARRDVAAGEELTVDYATITDDATFRLRCRCGTTGCRGTVTGTDWTRSDLQEAYGPHWVPGLLARIGATR